MHLRQDLEDIKVVKSDYDDYLFINGSVMILFWVNDCIFYAKDKTQINEVMNSLEESFLLESEEDVAGFIGL